jgi:tetratricopeptide (TPR) repeat protein
LARVDRRRGQRQVAHARAGAGAGSRARVATEDTLFFTRLRNRAKFVFLFLAIAFAASFVLFGVGTGFGGLQDIILQERVVGGGPSEDDARERIEENPRDAQAWRDLATALQNQGDVGESIAPLARYVELRPNDTDAQRELAGLYLQEADRWRQQAQAAQIGLQTDVPGSTFQPPSSSKVGEALSGDPIVDALSARHNEALNRAFTRMTEAYNKAVIAYQAVAREQPNDASVQFELAQTAEAAGDIPTAINGYKRFIELAPEDAAAEAVRERIKALQAQAAAGSTAAGG